MDVDGPARQFATQIVAEDLHVPRQHHQLGAFGLDHLIGFGFGLHLGGSRHRHVVKRHVVTGGQLVEIAVIGNDGADVQRQKAAFPAEQQVIETVAIAADHQHGFHRHIPRMQLPHHVEGRSEFSQAALQIGRRTLHCSKLDPHEKQAGALVVVLRGFFDVATAPGQKTGYRMHQAHAVGAGKGQDVGGTHGAMIVANR